MRLVVADTGPLHYLILISHIDILPTLSLRQCRNGLSILRPGSKYGME
jgi:hypothetical protein